MEIDELLSAFGSETEAVSRPGPMERLHGRDALAARVTLFGLALSVILFEVALTRVSSVLFHTHLTFLVIAFGLAALGMGAAWTHRRVVRVPERLDARLLSGAAALVSVSAALALVVITFSSAGFYLGLFAVPFAGLGAYAAAVYVLLARDPTRTYAFELGGGAVGAVLAPFCIQWLGDVDTALLAAGLAVLAAVPLWLILGVPHTFRRLALLGLPWLLLTLNVCVPGGVVAIDPFADYGFKPHMIKQTSNRGGRVVKTSYEAFARTDLVRTDERWVRYMFTDRMYTARIARWDGRSTRFAAPDLEELSRIKGFPFRVLRPESVLVLGAGGGFDVALALQGGSARVDAVEVNPVMIKFTRELGAFAGNVYDRPEVTVVNAEARRFLRESETRYDLINLSLMQTSFAEGRGNASVQNWVFTTEAIADYFARLRPGGVIAIVQNRVPIAEKTVSTVCATLGQQGFSTAQIFERLAVLSLSIADEDPPPPDANPFAHLVLVWSEPPPAATLSALADAASASGLVIRHLPGHGGTALYRALASGRMAVGEWVATHSRRIEAPTDERPFFFDIYREVPLFYLFVAAAALAVLVVAFGQDRIGARTRKCVRLVPTGWVAAFVLGAGLMLLQAGLIHRGQFLVGYPALAVAVVLGGMLACAGGGAALSVLLLPRRPAARLDLAVSGVICAICAQYLGWPLLVQYASGQGTAVLAALLFVFVAAAAFPAGMCFPAALEVFCGRDQRGAAAFYSADGISAVVGASAAVFFASAWGIGSLLLVSAVCYFLCAVLGRLTADSE
ncbi:hypothetical protein ACFL59_12245 [Planctomycetota bacterium]